MRVEYRVEDLANEFGVGYGTEYVITGPKDAEISGLQDELIRRVIGEENFFAPNRDVWEQIRISDGRRVD